MAEELGRELSWDSEIGQDSAEFVILPDGDYDFEVIDFDRARHAGSAKLPPCNKAIVHLRVSGPQGQTIIKHQLFLHSSTEGLLCQFFVGIGQRKRGETTPMNWNAIVGRRGRCKVGSRKFTNDQGNELTFNQVVKFYEPEEPAKFQPGRF